MCHLKSSCTQWEFKYILCAWAVRRQTSTVEGRILYISSWPHVTPYKGKYHCDTPPCIYHQLQTTWHGWAGAQPWLWSWQGGWWTIMATKYPAVCITLRPCILWQHVSTSSWNKWIFTPNIKLNLISGACWHSCWSTSSSVSFTWWGQHRPKLTVMTCI